jgi:hypothetical protein
VVRPDFKHGDAVTDESYNATPGLLGLFPSAHLSTGIVTDADKQAYKKTLRQSDAH